MSNFLETMRSILKSESCQGTPHRQIGTGWLVPGVWIEFNSPKHGRCTGEVALVDQDRLIVNHHSTRNALVGIRTEWVVRVLTVPPDRKEGREW